MTARNALLAVTGVTKRFGSDVAIDSVRFEVERGERFCLVGHNGAGKSTLLRLIAGLSYPSEGTISVLGGDPAREPSVRRRIGYLSDQPHLYDKLTGGEHLRLHAALYGLSPEEASVRSEGLLEDLGLNPCPRVERLSFGTRKKLALVLALVHEPDLLVLDEPTNGLDPASAEVVEDLLRRHVGAVVLSTHSLEFAAAFASEIGVMRNGRITSRGVRRGDDG
ncbi:MAG TPA: ABC transporter ATP-binding protein [Rubrobacteraceae bacterium]|nr:ABC transporter ATP-binding protein [Rubrobacteraceae bacterium]